MKFAMASGKLIDIEDLTVDDVDLDDIAHNLSKIQRFNGATPINVTYSVAEHCINLANTFFFLSPIILIKCALLHDATEAYLSDLLSPVKRLLGDYTELENEIHRIIFTRFNLQDWSEYYKNVCYRDKRIMLDEVETIMPDKLHIYESQSSGLEKLGCHIMYNNHPSTVKQCFLTMCKKLGIE